MLKRQPPPLKARPRGTCCKKPLRDRDPKVSPKIVSGMGMPILWRFWWACQACGSEFITTHDHSGAMLEMRCTKRT